MGLRDLLYVKKAIGKDGREFNCYKLRTMVINADELLTDEMTSNLNMSGNLKDDVRITKPGRILRKYWIDELPQLWNLLKGDMKLVGIRPMDERFWNRYPKDVKEEALKMKPGFLGVPYARRDLQNFNDCISTIRQYLDERRENPLLTDIKYSFKITGNIIFHGMRSS